jgi:hypothetical protein
MVGPDSQVLRTSPALGKNRSCFGEHQSSAAYGPAAEMHEMPVIGVPSALEVLAHWRNKYSVRKGYIPNRERIKKVSPKVVRCLS